MELENPRTTDRNQSTRNNPQNIFEEKNMDRIEEIESGKQSFIKAYGIYSSATPNSSQKNLSSSLFEERKSNLTPQSQCSNITSSDYQLHHKRNLIMRNFSNSAFMRESFLPRSFEMLEKNGFNFEVFDEEREITTNLANLCGALLNICYTLNDAVQFIKKGDLRRAKFTQKSKTYEYAECDRKKFKERLAGKFGILFGDGGFKASQECE